MASLCLRKQREYQVSRCQRAASEREAKHTTQISTLHPRHMSTLQMTMMAIFTSEDRPLLEEDAARGGGGAVAGVTVVTLDPRSALSYTYDPHCRPLMRLVH